MSGVNAKFEDEQCPVCGYYCLGKGGKFCIDKPSMAKRLQKKDALMEEWLRLMINDREGSG